MTLTVIHERYPYRYVDVGILENGYPDYRIQKYNEDTGRYKDMYLRQWRSVRNSNGRL